LRSIRNAQFSDKVIEVYLRGKALDECVDVASNKYIKGSQYQQWELERRSRTVLELASLVGECPILKETNIVWPSSGVDGFIVIKDHWRDQLLKESGLMRQACRPALFGDKDFALKLKGTVQNWSSKVMGIEGYAVLFGVVGGETHAGSTAYNWYLTDDLCEIVFLDPLNGRELTSKGLQKRGFHAEWAIY